MAAPATFSAHLLARSTQLAALVAAAMACITHLHKS
jgi:hypothetical protein